MWNRFADFQGSTIMDEHLYCHTHIQKVEAKGTTVSILDRSQSRVMQESPHSISLFLVRRLPAII